MKPKMIPEMFVLRAAACLSITLLHALNRIYPDPNALLDFVKLLLTFGTPAFVFISEMILSYSYPDDTPKSFWRKRIQYIFVPYLLFGAFYALMKASEDWFAAGEISPAVLWSYLWRHILLGDYHGYFILIVFQFYLLHTLFNRYIRRASPGIVLFLSLAINLIYLASFNFTRAPSFAEASYIWEKMYWLPFAGWLFYFSLAYYCGRNYEKFHKLVSKYGGWSIPATVVAGSIAYMLQAYDVLSKISSKRVDMVFVTASLIFLICFSVSKVQRLPPFFVWVSKYSFGIYLLHPLWMAVMVIPMQKNPEIATNWIGMTILFIGSVFGSIGVAYMLNKFRWGPYFIGKISPDIQQRSASRPSAASSSDKSAATRA